MYYFSTTFRTTLVQKNVQLWKNNICVCVYQCIDKQLQSNINVNTIKKTLSSFLVYTLKLEQKEKWLLERKIFELQSIFQIEGGICRFPSQELW